jgi:hypothetical protein
VQRRKNSSKSTSFEKSSSSYSELTLSPVFVQFDAECGSSFDSIVSGLPTTHPELSRSNQYRASMRALPLISPIEIGGLLTKSKGRRDLIFRSLRRLNIDE